MTALSEALKEFEKISYHDFGDEYRGGCEFLLTNGIGKCNCQIDDIKAWATSLAHAVELEVLERVEKEVIGEDNIMQGDYPINHNFSFLEAKLLNNLRKEQCAKLTQMRGGK